MIEQYLTTAEARALYAAGDSAHDFDHVLRVVHWAERIAAGEGADLTVVRLAALLHDVPAPAPEQADGAQRSRHHWEAAAFAARLLAGRGLDAASVANVRHCIEAHRFRDQSVQPQTLEACCLYDADKLDSIGAVGVARAFAFGGAHGSRLWLEPWPTLLAASAPPAGADYTPVHEFVYKLRTLSDTLHTQTARLLGAERHAFMVDFFTRLDREMQGLV